MTSRLRRVWACHTFTNYGPEERDLERRLSERFGGRDVILLANGTQACEIALRALDVAGRPVYLPSFTFSATVHAVLNAGGRPRFVDCDPRTWNLDPDALPRRLERDAVLFPVHIFGVPCDHERLRRLGRPLVYDACEAVGSQWRSEDVAALGKAAVFSMHATKLLAAAEGAFIVTSDRRLARRCRQIRNFGHLGDQKPRLAAHNAKLSELHAAMGAESLSGFDRVLARRRRDWWTYRALLADIPGLALQEVPEGCEPNGQLLAVRVERTFPMGRDHVLETLLESGIECRAYFDPPGHLYPLWKGRFRGTCPRATELSRRVLCLPFPHGISRNEMLQVVGALRKLGRQRGRAGTPRTR